ncbi:MAG: serine/threonine-protein kinase [bacterium]
MTQYCPECARTFDDDSMRLCPHDGSRVFSLERGKDPLIGMVIDERFRIEKLIGEGGMGSVYRGVQLSVNRDVAVKVLRPELANRDIALERFFREARTISQLTHPNIVRLIEFGQDRDRDLLYLVMELVNGFNLADLLSKGRMRLPLALDIAHQVCGALSEPHNAGVIHRDLKPDNILVMPMADGSVKPRCSTSASPARSRRTPRSQRRAWCAARRRTWRPNRLKTKPWTRAQTCMRWA